MNFKELKLEEIKGLKIGHASNDEAKTGVTVLYFENGGVGGVDVSGGGPASRETPLLSPITADNSSMPSFCLEVQHMVWLPVMEL